MIAFTAEKIAELRRLPVQELLDITCENARCFFSVWCADCRQAAEIFRDLAELAAFCKVFHCNLNIMNTKGWEMDFFKRMEEAVVERMIHGEILISQHPERIVCAACRFMGCFSVDGN